jgi:hypothetical protein
MTGASCATATDVISGAARIKPIAAASERANERLFESADMVDAPRDGLMGKIFAKRMRRRYRPLRRRRMREREQNKTNSKAFREKQRHNASIPPGATNAAFF